MRKSKQRSILSVLLIHFSWEYLAICPQWKVTCHKGTNCTKNPSLGVLGFSYEGDAFLIDNLAYHLELSPYIGRELAEITNDEISTIGIKFSLGLEYYFNLNQKDKLSIGGGIGYDVFGYFYNNHSARYNNYVIPFSITFWHNRVGYSLLYEPCISKGVPTNNPSALPELAPNYICFSVRLK